LRKASKYSQTAVTISLPKTLLRQIDARADRLGIPRSQYMALIARRDILIGGSLTLSPADAGNPPRQIDLTDEVIEFLKLAIPALIEHEQALRNHNTQTPPLELEVPESLADKGFWLDVLDELDEILEYKWLESERAGFDIGMDRGIREWLHKHYTAWAAAHPPPQNPAPPS
jgi:hypothetical protein